MKTAIISAAALAMILVLANFFPGLVLMVGSVVFTLAFSVWDKFCNTREAKQ